MHALDENRFIDVLEAEKRKDYQCPECKSLVRLRFGKERSAHFYHIAKNSNCRHAKKGLIHLNLQKKLEQLLPGAILEKRFPSIDRVADVYFAGTVYEIQYSPMSQEEAKARTQDYESLGLDIVWILHDNTYNKGRLSPVERLLRAKTCYYSNHNALGEGIIYDKRPEHAVDLTQKKRLPRRKRWPEHLSQRAKVWKFYHTGDQFDKAIKNRCPKEMRSNPFKIFQTAFRNAYYALLHFLLQSTGSFI